MNSITIGGKTYTSNSSISIISGNVIIDGNQTGDTVSGVVEIRVLSGSIGTLTTDANVNCGEVTGNVSAGGNVNCDDVGGNVKASGNVNCDDVKGSVSAQGNIMRG